MDVGELLQTLFRMMWAIMSNLTGNEPNTHVWVQWASWMGLQGLNGCEAATDLGSAVIAYIFDWLTYAMTGTMGHLQDLYTSCGPVDQ
jgi:hypothetical protein